MLARSLAILTLLFAGVSVADPTDITQDVHVETFTLLYQHLQTNDRTWAERALKEARKARNPALISYVERWAALDPAAIEHQRQLLAAIERFKEKEKAKDAPGALQELVDVEDLTEACMPSPFAINAKRRRAGLESARGQFDRAVELFDSAEKGALELGWKIGGFLAAYGAANVLEAKADWRRSITAAKRALAHLESLNRPRERALAFLHLAGVQGRVREFTAAERSVQRALESAIAASDPSLLASTYASLGAARWRQGNADGAIEASLQAAEAFRGLNAHSRVVRAVTNVVLFLSELGRYGEALGHYEALQREIAEKKVEVPLHLLQVNAGIIYMNLGMMERAIAVQREALDGAMAAKDAYVTFQARGNLAVAHFRAGHFERALEMVDALLEPKTRDRYPEEATVSYTLRAACLRSLKRFAEAKAAIDEAARRAELVDDFERLPTIAEERGDLAQAQGRYEEAIGYYRQSLEDVRELGRRGLGEALAFKGITRAEYARGRYEAAVDAAEQALAAYALLGSDLGDHEAHDLRREAHQAAEVGIVAAARWAEAASKPERRAEAIDRAFALSELGRGRRIAAAIANPRGLLTKHVPAALAQEDQSSQRAVESARQALLQALRKKDRAATSAARKHLDAAWRTRRNVVARVQREAARVAAIVYPQPVPRPSIQAHLDTCCALVSYHFVHTSETDEFAYAFVLTRDRAALVGLGEAKPIHDEVSRYLVLASTRGGAEAKLAATLFDGLIRPIQPYLKKKTRLVIVSDGELAFLPFGALIDRRRPKRLIENYEVVAAPSATVYDALLAQQAKRSGTGLLAVGDPAYPKGGPFIELPGSRKEVAAVAALFPKEQRTTLLGNAATTEALGDLLMKRKGRLRALHLACHARIDPRRPRMSGLVLSNGEMFDLDRVFRTRIDADLAVLSACDSAQAQVLDGVGTQGFVRGFLFAGTPRVVVSSWRVADESTRDLMQAFYEAMTKQGMAPSAALRHAKRQVIARGGAKAHPYYWAPFVLWGLPN